LLDIRITVVGSQLIDKIEKSLKELPRFVSNYAFEHINTVLNKFDRSTIDNIIYGQSGVVRRTGGLGKALISYAQKINQYSFEIRADFSDSVPYVKTHVGTGMQIISAKHTRFLWIPKQGGPADIFPRQPVRNFYNQYVKVKPHGLQTIYNMKSSVGIPRRINPSDIQENLENTVNIGLPSIAMRALNNWKKTNGY
jgi:hypothetical protein